MKNKYRIAVFGLGYVGLPLAHEFSKKFDFKHSVMVNSGSSANLVMVAALKKYFGWKDGDEIIVSSPAAAESKVTGTGTNYERSVPNT